MTQEYADRLALEVAQQVHRSAGAKQTFLFGSRARGDHRPDSDIDVLVITAAAQPDGWLERLRQQAKEIQKTSLPEASGIDIIHMPEDEFLGKIHLRNNMGNTIIKEGFPVMSDERLGYRNDLSDEEVDWSDVEQKLEDADGAVRWVEAIEQAGIIDLNQSQGGMCISRGVSGMAGLLVDGGTNTGAANTRWDTRAPFRCELQV